MKYSAKYHVFPAISCYIAESRFPLGQCREKNYIFLSFLKYLLNYGFLVFSSSWINTLYFDWLCPQCKAYGRAKQKIKQMKRTSREYKVIVRILRGNVVYLFKYLLQGTGF